MLGCNIDYIKHFINKENDKYQMQNNSIKGTNIPHDDLYPLPIYQVENIYAYIRLVMYPNCHACNV